MRRDYADVRARYKVGDRLLPYFPTFANGGVWS